MFTYPPSTRHSEIDVALSRFSFWKHLYAMWNNFIGQEELPQFDRWLAAELKKQKSFGKRDRFWYSEILFAGFRFGYLAAVLEYLQSELTGQKQKKRISPFINTTDFNRLLHEFTLDFPDYSAIKQYWISMKSENFFKWNLLRYAAENSWNISRDFKTVKLSDLNRQIFNAARKQLSESRKPEQQMVWVGIPFWFQDSLQERAQQSQWDSYTVQRFLSYQARRSPLWLRLNDPAKKPEVLQEMETSGFQITRQGLAIQAEGSKGIYELNAYKQGYLEVQDLASQLIGYRVAAKPGEMVWDCCAGGGGKTLQIAARPGGDRGAVYASDIRDYKLDILRKRALKAHLHNIRTLVWEGEKLPEFGKEIQKRGGFHWVLVDAPCSASGTWRRNPEAKFRFRPETLPGLLKLQQQLLTNAAAAVIPGGHLVYATCSWFAAENEGVVQQFLQNSPAFQLESQELLGNPYQNSDTMFAAVMVRK
jgi:16S rRNA (cytosine967-C5)-methyltransferase